MKPNRLTKALLETADDMRRAGVMDAATHTTIALRQLGGKADVVAEPISGPKIRGSVTSTLHRGVISILRLQRAHHNSPIWKSRLQGRCRAV